MGMDFFVHRCYRIFMKQGIQIIKAKMINGSKKNL